MGLKQKLQDMAKKSGERIDRYPYGSFFGPLINNLVMPCSDVDIVATNLLVNGTYDDGGKANKKRFIGPSVYFGTKIAVLSALTLGVYLTLEKLVNQF